MATVTYTITVAQSGGINVYYVDGVANPALSFSKGNTYVFDLSDSSNSGHPLRFKDSSGSSFSTGVTVTNTPGTAGAKVEIVVAAATPSSLRYYCTVHGNGMGNTIAVAFDATYSALYGSGKYGRAAYGIASGIVTVAGVSGTSALGSITLVSIAQPSGVSATGQVTAVTTTNDSSKTVASVVGTSALGAVTTVINTFVITVANNGYINRYYSRGVEAPVLTFARGNTYTFDQSDSSNSGHPLRFKDASGTSYTTGVTVNGTPGNAGANVQIVVDGGTPSSLRYYCTVHGNGMGNTINVTFNADYVATYGSGKYGNAQYGVAFGIQQLTGVQATGAIGSVEVDTDESLASVSATGAIGTVKPNISKTVTGVQGAGQANSIVIPADELLPSVVATGIINTVGVGNSATLTGVQATGSVNTLVEEVTEALASVQGTSALGTITPSGVTTTFNAANFSRARTVRLVELQSSRRAA